MIVSDLVTEIRLELGDYSSNNWSDDEIITYINEAYRYFYNMASMITPQILSKTATLTLLQGMKTIS